MFDEIFNHRWMIHDKVRVETYQEAIREMVNPGDVVLEVGAGSGIMSFFAARAGAARVYAMERNPRLCREAAELAKHNGLADKIVFLAGRSSDLRLPQKVDIIISELIGNFGIEENFIGFKAEARDLFLKPGGKLLPVWLKTWFMPVEAEKFWKDFIGVWDRDHYGYDFSSVRKDALGAGHYHNYLANNGKILSDPGLISDVNTYTMDKNDNKNFTGRVVIKENGVIHGLGGYFDSGLTENIVLSSSMIKPDTCWMQAFYPLLEPLEVMAGDELHCDFLGTPRGYRIHFQLQIKLFRDGKEIAWRNQAEFPCAGRREQFLINNQHYTPVLGDDEITTRDILTLCDGSNSITTIVEKLMELSPERYTHIEKTTRTVATVLENLVEKY